MQNAQVPMSFQIDWGLANLKKESRLWKHLKSANNNYSIYYYFQRAITKAVLTIIAFVCIFLNSSSVNATVTKTITDHTLTNCKGKGTLTLGNKIKSISEDYMTWEHADIKKVVVSPSNKYYKTVDGVLYNKKMTKLIYYPKNKTGNSFKIPKSVKMIACGAFSYNKNLINVTMHSGIKKLDSYIFYNCYKLKTVKNKTLITKIPYGMFYNCQSLESFTINSEVINIAPYAFYNCKKLGNMNISEAVRNIGENAFTESVLYFNVSSDNKTYCSEGGVLFSKDKKRLEYYPVSKLGEYVIPKSVEEINDTAFVGSIGLTGLTLNETMEEFKINLLKRCFNLERLSLSAKLNNMDLGESFFSQRYYLNGYNLKEINVADDNKSYKSYNGALYSYDYKNLYIIPFGADKLVLHENVTNINKDMCQNKFSSIEIPETNKIYTVYDGVLYDKAISKIVIFPGKLTEYKIPATVKDISVIMNKFDIDDEIGEPLEYNNMLYNLENISVEKGNSYFSANNGVLYNKDMTELLIYPQMKKGSFVVPDIVKKVDIGAFASASKLTEIKFSDNMEYANIVVTGCTSLKKIFCNNEMEIIRICGRFRHGEQPELNIKKIYLPGKLTGIYISDLNKSVQFYGYNNTGEYTIYPDMGIDDVKSYIEDLGYKYASMGLAPKITKASAQKDKDDIVIKWNTNTEVDGYIIFVKKNLYSYQLREITNGKKKSCIINKSKFENWDNFDDIIDDTVINETGSDTEHMFIRAYKIINGVKVYSKRTHIRI